MPIAALVHAAGDTVANDFEALFREHYALVYRTAYSVTGNRQDAEDVLQTIFLRLLRPAPFAATAAAARAAAVILVPALVPTVGIAAAAAIDAAPVGALSQPSTSVASSSKAPTDSSGSASTARSCGSACT